MAKLPVKKVYEFGKNNKKEIVSMVTTIAGAGKKLSDHNKSNDKNHYRKTRYYQYKTDILPSLNNYNRDKLLSIKYEVETFIKQLQSEKQQVLKPNKPLFNKRIKNWSIILIQINDTLKTLDYQEFQRIYNNPAHQSEYFTGNEKLENNFRDNINAGDQELISFLKNHTNEDEQTIKRDFFLN